MSQEALPKIPEEVVSRGALLCGLRPISSFADVGRDEVVVARELYEVLVCDELSAYPWRFASGEQQLENDPNPPLDRYESAWHMPVLPEGMALFMENVRLSDDPVTYDIVGQRIYAHCDPTSTPIAHYQYRAEEAYWTPGFTLAMVLRCAQMFAESVTRKKSQIDGFTQSFEVQLARAKLRDAQSKSYRKMDLGKYSRFRQRGYSPTQDTVRGQPTNTP